jgi:hypothetical protein
LPTKKIDLFYVAVLVSVLVLLLLSNYLVYHYAFRDDDTENIRGATILGLSEDGELVYEGKL